MVFGENGGDRTGDYPREALPGSLRESGVDPGQRTDLSGDARAGRLGNRVGPGLEIDVRMRFRFPRKVSSLCPRI